MREADYQAHIIRKLRTLFPGCVVLKNDSGYLQGILDLSIFYEVHWAMLEVKISANAAEQPNQRYYVDLLNEMSFAAIIYPENEQEVLDELQRSFENRRKSRVPKRK